MKKKSASKFGFFNLRVLFAFLLCLTATFLALAGAGAFSITAPDSVRGTEPAAGAIEGSRADSFNSVRSEQQEIRRSKLREPVQSMHLLAAETGWVSTKSHLLWTTTSGTEWRDISPPVPGAKILGTFFRDFLNGWTVLSVRDATKNLTSMVLGSTSNGGDSWSLTELLSPSDYALNNPSEQVSIEFLSPARGWIMIKLVSSSNFSRGLLLATSDGGNTWRKLPNPPVGDSIHFTNDNDGWLAGGPGGNDLYVTRDSGRSWSRPLVVEAPSAGYETAQVAYDLPTFQNTKDGILPLSFMGPQGPLFALYSTNDAGRSWTLKQTVLLEGEFPLENKVAAAVISSDLVIVAPRENGAWSLLALADGSITRKKAATTNLNLDSDANIVKIDFLEGDVGWLLVNAGRCAEFKSKCTQETKLFATNNGGETLIDITPPLVEAVSARISEFDVSPDSVIISQNHRGFDQCEAATVSDMQAWWTSTPFSDAGVYIGGSNRSCPNSAVTASWVNSVFGQGWHLMPLWVGPQAPCTACSTCSVMSSDPTTAQSQGVAEANSASDRATALGLTNTIVYFNMEPYGTGSTCQNAVRAFLNGWVQQMHNRGNSAGVYGNASNAQNDWSVISNVPDAVWISKWDGNQGVFGLTPLSDSFWPNHQRIHQYQGPHNETWNGVTFEIDSDFEDGPVAASGGGGAADLALQSVTVTQVNPIPGGAIRIGNIVQNIGGTTSSSYTITFYASTDSTITPSDYSIGSPPTRAGLAPGAFDPNTFTDGNLPANLPNGTYYIGAIITVSPDANTSNNVNHDPTPITVGTQTRIIALSGNLAFGDVPVGSSAQRTLTISNGGNSTLTVSGISYPSGFSGSFSGTILAGGSHDVTVTFAPGSPGGYGGTVTVASNATSGTNTTTASGTGTTTATRIISLSGNLAFGNVQVGSSAQRTLTINNSGNSTLTVSGISYPSGFSGSFSGTIGAGSSHDVTVTFAPGSVGSYGGTVTVNSDATSGTNTIGASGTGTNTVTRIISLSGNLAFGDVTVGSSAQRTLTISNSGTSTLTVSSISYPSGFSGSFSGAIGAGGSHDVTVTFAPGAVGSYGGTVTVNSDATSGTNTIGASGTGTNTVTRIIGLSGNLAFGNVTVGSSAQRTLTISNSGTSTLTVSSISYPSGFSGSFSGAIGAGNSHDITVTFAPGSVGSYGGTVTVNSDATSGNNTIAASGNGTTTATPTPNPSCTPTITQSSTQTITALNSASCNNGTGHTDNSYWRAFNMTSFVGSNTYNVTSVSFGIEQATGAGGTQSVTVRLHTSNQNFPTGYPGSLTQIATATVNVPDSASNTVFIVPITATVPAGAQLVMELFTPDGTGAGNLFFIGSNADPESGSSYLSAANCGLTTPTTTAVVGFPNMHVVFNVNGNCGGPPPPSPTPTATATATATPCGTTVTFSNPAPITINDALPASPYPSNITVAGVTSSVSKVTVTITGFNHTFPSDVDMLLVGPGGQKFILVSDVIGGTDAVGINWTLDDAAAAFIGSTGTPASGTFKPTNYTTCQDPFAAPAPPAPYLSPGGIGITCGTDTLAAFNGVNPNGTWSLYVVDDLGADVGSVSGGWSVNITTAGAGCAPTTLGNISTRLRVETGNNVLIGGFIVTGTQPKKIIVRAIGPSLASLFTGVLADPILELHGPAGFTTITNDNWRSNQQAEILATGIPPSNDLESAIVATLPANNAGYSAIVRGVNNGTGIGVVEAYDLDRTVDSKLANISTRGFVNTGDNVMIGGMIVVGSTPASVLIRAIGPSLINFGVPNALQDPTLELRDGSGTLLDANDNWWTDQEAEILATNLAPTDDRESAILWSLPPGNYTAIVRGLNSTTGVALVEAYQLQ